MTAENLRREPRVPLSEDLTVTLQLPEGDREYPVSDISYRGVFLVTDSPLPLRKLVRLSVDAGGEEPPIRMMGLTAHQLDPAEAAELNRRPGMGIHLFSVGEETHRRWRRFVREHYESDPDVQQELRRLEWPHVVAHLPTMDAVEKFLELGSKPVGIFVRTSKLHEPGTRLICDVVHPVTEESLGLEAEVVEVVESPPRDRGLHLEFSQVDGSLEEHVRTFVRGEEWEEDAEESSEEQIDAAMP